MEEFRAIKFYNINNVFFDFTGLYEVSNTGKIKSLNYNHTKRSCCLKNHIAGEYEQTLLLKNNKKVYANVNRLVAFAFPEICGEWFEGAVCNHRDENKLNNNANNLEWVSVRENNIYGTRLEKVSRKRKNGNGSKPVLQYDLNGNFIKEWPSSKEIKRKLGFADSNVRNSCNGKYKTAYGFIWKYKKKTV